MPVLRDLVFIVDGDQAVRDSLRFVVELDGVEVRTCGSVTELLTHPELSAGCCAIVDASTLGRDRELLKRLESSREVLPVVLIADHVSHRMLIRSISPGAFCIVEKPVLDDALLQSINAVRRR